MYCEKCGLLFDAGRRCPDCRSRKVRDPRQGDVCLLTEQSYIWSDMLSDVLTQEGIPFLKKGTLGAGVVAGIGGMLETYRFLVPYELIPRGREVVEGIFGGEAEVQEEPEA